MRRVIIESPYAGNVELHLRYLRACMHDCLTRREAPFASHGLYTQPGVLDDRVAQERANGIRTGFMWREIADATIVYTDLGISRGMQFGIDHAERLIRDYATGTRANYHTIQRRTLGTPWNTASGIPNAGYALDNSAPLATDRWGK